MVTTEVAAVTSGAEVTGKEGFLDRASWGALFAGFFVGMGTLFLLLSLGAAVGFTAVDPRNFDSWKNAGIGVGVWGGVSAIIASFFSAWVAGRLSRSWTRMGGALHGIALWGLTWAVTLWLGAMLVGGVVRGAATVAGQAAQGSELSRQDVQQGAQRAEAQAEQLGQQLEQNAGEVSAAAEGAGKAGAWGAFLAALFTMLASAAGGAAAISRRHVALTAGEFTRRTSYAAGPARS